jgi:hypothetical protein
VAGFLPLIQPLLKTMPQLVATYALQAGTVQMSLGMILGTTHIHPNRLARVRSRAESQVLWCNTHNVWVGAQMTKLAVLQLEQAVGARPTTRGVINQEAGAPPLPSFPHTMLSVKNVKVICDRFSLKNSLPTTKLRPMCKQDIWASRVCRMRTKITCVTSVVFNYKKFWLDFGVTTRSLR